MPKRLALTIGFTPGPQDRKHLLERVRIAEEVGVEAVFTAESWGRDQFSLLTQMALATSKIKLGTGIAPVFGRSPALLAMTAATLDELSEGRVILGLGTSGARVIEHWHGEKFAKPLRRLREYCEIINIIVSGEKLFYEGEIFKLQRGFKLLFEPVRKHIPIYVASISPVSMEQMGEFADGWMPIFWPKSKYRDGLATIGEGMRKASRPPGSVTVAASMQTVIDPDLDRAKVTAAGPVSWYVSNMGDFYHRMLTRNGFGDEVAAMRAAAEAHKPAPFRTNPEIMAAMGDRLLDEIAVYGGLETVAAGVDEHREAGVDLPVVSMPGGNLKDVERILGTLVS